MVANLITNIAVPVSNGVFTVTLDYGNVFDGDSYWLEIGVRTNGSASGFTTLTPRQNVTGAPYSLYSLTAGSVNGVLAATNLPANVALLNGNANFTGTLTASNFAGNGAGLTNLTTTNPAGSGAALTNLAYHVYNVRDFGATDGGADSAAIMAAFTAWTNTGGVLYFPSGTYYDTNHYVIGPYGSFLVPALLVPLVIRGDGMPNTIWEAQITNSTFIVSSNYPFEMHDILINDYSGLGGSAGVGGVNNGVFAASNGGPVTWSNVRFNGFKGIACQLQGWAGVCLYGCQAGNSGIGFSVAGYCDGWVADLRVDACSVAGLSIGDADTYTGFLGNKQSNAGRFHIMGNNNNIAVIAGRGTAYTVGGYCENSTNGFCAVGHPDGSDAGNPPGSITISDAASHDSNIPLAKLYCSPALLSIRHCGLGAATNVISMAAAYDSTPMIFEAALGNVLVKFSDGSMITNSGGYLGANYTTVNLTEQKYTKLNTNPPAQYFGNPALLNANRSAPSAITLSGSPFKWTNSTGANVYVFYTPGLASDTVAINGTVVFHGDGTGHGTLTIPLEPGEWLTATYAGTPSAFWKPF